MVLYYYHSDGGIIIKDYISSISITVGIIITIIAWLFPEVSIPIRIIITLVALLIPAVYAFAKWVNRQKKELEQTKQELVKARRANAQWRRNFYRVDYEKNLLAGCNAAIESSLRVALANSKEVKLGTLLGAHAELNERTKKNMEEYVRREGQNNAIEQ